MEIVFKDLDRQIKNLVLYSDIRKDKVFKKFCDYIKKGSENNFLSFFKSLVKKAEDLNLSGNIFKKYILHLVLNSENVFSLALENKTNIKNTSSLDIAQSDLKIIYHIMNIEVDKIFLPFRGSFHILTNYKSVNSSDLIYEEFINLDETEFLEKIEAYYKTFGCGIMARSKAFTFDTKKGFLPVKNFDPVVFDDIVGCEYQKESLIKNTEAFLRGIEANNAILTGARGTGKSSLVKALANKYYKKGLRLIEISKEDTINLSKILKKLSKRGLHFIIFMDDLSFEDFELQYKYLKSVLEGSSEKRPINVLFYATSNRRNIIKQKWSDRTVYSEDDEIHKSDGMNEKMSLVDRFGLNLVFSKPNPKEYLEIVKAMAKKYNISISEDELSKRAMAWEINQRGLSGRTAKQFINSIISEYSE